MKIILLDFTSFWFQSKYANHISQILGTSEGKSKTKTAKNLKKVQRALKTLGVNFLHFDDQTAENDSAKSGEGVNSGSSCDKEYCRMGCVCDSVTGKYTFDAVGLSEILKGKQKLGVKFSPKINIY